MFTDIAGFTTLMAQNEQKAMELLEKNRRIQKKIIKKYHGIWLKEVGDGILACFSSVLNAVYCASSVLKEAAEDPDLNLSIAIHIGEVVFLNGDVFGDGVNVASRIEGIAEPGRIIISEAAYENIRNIEGLRFQFLEEREFKNVENKIRIHEVFVDKEFPSSEPKPSLNWARESFGLDIPPPDFEEVPPQEYSASVGGAYGRGWNMIWKYFLPLLLVTVLIAFLEVPYWIINDWENIRDGGHLTSGDIFLQIFGFFYWLLLLTPLEFGSSMLYLKAARDQDFHIREIRVGFYYYWNTILARILVTVIIVLGFFMLIIPGIVFAIRLAFVRYLVVDRGLDPVEAVKTSWKMTAPHAWTIFGMALLTIPLVMFGLIALVVGVLISAMWISTAFASIYAKAEALRTTEASS